MKTEVIDGMKIIHDGEEEAHTEKMLCSDAADIQERIDTVLEKHPSWVVARLDFKYDGGELMGVISFTIPFESPKQKCNKYKVSWVERYDCSMTVEAPNKKKARELAEDCPADASAFQGSSNWKIEEVK